jgi:hypothetical protein
MSEKMRIIFIYALSNPYTLYTVGKGPGREADHSSLSSAEVKNGGAIPPLPYKSSWRCA